MITIKTGNIQSQSEFGTGMGFPITLKDAAVQVIGYWIFLKKRNGKRNKEKEAG